MNRSGIDRVYIPDIEKRIEDGAAFEAASKVSVTTATPVQWLFITGSKKVIIYSRRITSNGNELTYQAFKGATVTDNGTAVSIVKRNGNSPIANTVTIFSGPTTTADGDGIPPVYMPGSSGVGNSTAGQFDQEGYVRILEPNTIYMTRVTNAGSVSPAQVEWYLLWAELTIDA